MGKYKIKIDYQTGNSFGSEETSDYLELEWDDLATAKLNIKYIKEHYEFYKECNYSRYSERKSKEDLFVENKLKEWFVPNKDSYTMMYSLKLKADNGNLMQLHPFWCGYFERLICVEIVVNSDDNDMKIMFN